MLSHALIKLFVQIDAVSDWTLLVLFEESYANDIFLIYRTTWVLLYK